MSKPKEVYGRLNLSWSGNTVLPLEQAHKVQEILAKYAVGLGEAYRPDSPNIPYIVEYSPPDVSITVMPVLDARGMTYGQRQEWEQSVREAEGDTFLTPQEFLALRGE